MTQAYVRYSGVRVQLRSQLQFCLEGSVAAHRNAAAIDVVVLAVCCCRARSHLREQTKDKTANLKEIRDHIPVLNPRVRRTCSSCCRFCPGPRVNALLTFTAIATALLSRAAARSKSSTASCCRRALAISSRLALRFSFTCGWIYRWCCSVVHSLQDRT